MHTRQKITIICTYSILGTWLDTNYQHALVVEIVWKISERLYYVLLATILRNPIKYSQPLENVQIHIIRSPE